MAVEQQTDELLRAGGGGERLKSARVVADQHWAVAPADHRAAAGGVGLLVAHRVHPANARRELEDELSGEQISPDGADDDLRD